MIQVTDAARAHVRRLAEKAGKPGAGLRVAVAGGGCSGLSYLLDFAQEASEGDEVIDGDPPVFVDPKSLRFLDGLTLDFDGGLNGKGLVFDNPNASSTCGCGSSFSP